MIKLTQWLYELFNPEDFNDLDVAAIAGAFNDARTRAIWLSGCFEEIRAINMAVDKRLLSGDVRELTDLCARRKAFQDILQAALSARRKAGQDVRPNPRNPGVNLDRVTA